MAILPMLKFFNVLSIYVQQNLYKKIFSNVRKSKHLVLGMFTIAGLFSGIMTGNKFALTCSVVRNSLLSVQLLFFPRKHKYFE
jgi:hypothetical protein